MKAILLLMIGVSTIYLSTTNSSKKVRISKKYEDALYEYFQYDSIYNEKINSSILKILYTEKNNEFDLEVGKNYKVEVIKWNPGKILFGNDTFNVRGSCYHDFGIVKLDSCMTIDADNKISIKPECPEIYAEYYEIVDVLR